MKLTKRGVCYDLAVTPYIHKEVYNYQVIYYHFSSEINLSKFRERMGENREALNTSLTKRFKFEVKNDVLCDLRLYNSVENRGFYIEADGKVIRWLEEITLIGQKIDKEN